MFEKLKSFFLFEALMKRHDINQAYKMVGPEDSWYATITTVHNSLAEIQIVVDNSDVRRFNTYGYPKANNHQTVLLSPAIWQEWSLGTNQFFLQLQSDMIEGYVQGYSGGGIFLDIDADESLLMGLFARYQMEERGRVIYAQSLKNINALLSEKRWVEVTFSYLGAGRVSKRKLESHVSKTIKNLGPNFNPDLNLKTAISVRNRYNEDYTELEPCIDIEIVL